jgi:hypothetical protein
MYTYIYIYVLLPGELPSPPDTPGWESAAPQASAEGSGDDSPLNRGFWGAGVTQGAPPQKYREYKFAKTLRNSDRKIILVLS